MMAKTRWKHLNRGQRVAYGWGLVVSLAACGTLLLPGFEFWHAKGPPNIGHESVQCSACHGAGEGGPSLLRLEFVYPPVRNEECLDCHENPKDRHPVADFSKPEFALAQDALGVRSCVNCHHQHQGVRVTVTPVACKYCHDDTEVEDDPLDVPHAELIESRRWETCLGCHDFHGNHEWQAPKRLADALTPDQIRRYLDGGESPYGYRKMMVIDTMKMESESEPGKEQGKEKIDQAEP